MKMPARNIAITLASVGVVALTLAWYVRYQGGPGSAPVAMGPPPLESMQVPRSNPKADNGIRPAIKEALDASTPARKRIALVRAGGVDLEEPEITALLGEISTGSLFSSEPEVQAEYFHEICHLLRKIPAARERLARVLAGVAADSKREMVARDYAIQHLRQLWVLAKDDATVRQGIQRRFESLVKADPAVTGPALLSLHVLGGDARSRGGEVPDSEIQPLVVEVLGKIPDGGGIPAAIAALRITGDRGLGQLSPKVREIAADPSNHALVRMAAISTLSTMESPPPVAFLESLDRSDPKVAEAVRLVLQKSR